MQKITIIKCIIVSHRNMFNEVGACTCTCTCTCIVAGQSITLHGAIVVEKANLSLLTLLLKI